MAKQITMAVAAIVVFMVALLFIPVLMSLSDNIILSRALSTVTRQGYWVLAQDQCVDGNLLPCGNNSQDIGRPDRVWRDLYLSEGSVHIGSLTLQNVDNELTLSGSMRATHPVKVQDGLMLMDAALEQEYFHVLLSGEHTNADPLPEAFDHTMVFETTQVENPSSMEVVFWDADNYRPDLIINAGSPGRASVFERSLIVGAHKGTKPLDADYTLGILDYPNAQFDTSVSGADLGVEDDLEVLGTIYTDEIRESSLAAGVTFPGRVSIANWHDEDLSEDGYAKVGSVTLQWGNETSSSKEPQFFAFPSPFEQVCAGVQTTSTLAASKSVFSVTGVTSLGFTIDTDKEDVEGFYWIAVGY